MPKSDMAATTAAVKAFYKQQAQTAGAIGGTDGVGYALLCADLIGCIVDGVTGGSAGGGLAGGANIFASLVTSGETATIPNPMFIANGHDEPVPCPLTAAYMSSRVWKGIGGTSLSLIGMGASAGTAGVNVLDVAIHGNASGSTAAHLLKLGLLARSYRQSQTISSWLTLIMGIKAAKLAIRGGQTAAAAIPAASLPVGVAAAVLKAGIKMTATNTSLMTAMEIHWRAYREQVVSGAFGGGGKTEGPATRIFVELLQRRGLTRVFGQYDPIGMIREPAGWQVLGDKILLI
jgi:hypothetical protein